MKVTIWDLDYYYAAEKRDQFNPDAMKISSFHKQSGDNINFVVKQDDIYRPYDLYYIIKENPKTPNPPLEFFTNSRVRWWGKAFKRRINWRMDRVMLACRPDYLLYPEKNTIFERAEQVRLLDDAGEVLPIMQDWTNSYKNKKVLVTDTHLWTTSRENLIYVLNKLQGIQNVTFFEPIWLPKLADDKEIMQLFLKLNLTAKSNLKFVPITFSNYKKCAAVVEKMREHFTHVAFNPIPLKNFTEEQWLSKQVALDNWNELKSIVLDAKKRKIRIKLMPLKSRYDTPYFLLFETVSKWTDRGFQYSWLEWLTIQYGPHLRETKVMFWGNPHQWSEVFRDLVRQTYTDTEFMIQQWGQLKLSINDIPWTIWKDEFRYGI